MTTPLISIENLGHSYGPGQPTILRDISFAAGAGEFICVVGPSGTGKTTLLRCLAGLQRPSEGRVVFQGKVISGPPRKLVVVFQDYSRSLMPWLSVLENVTLPLRAAGLALAERNERAMTVLEQVGLAHAGAKYPWQLSGGMQQRVAIARALACRPAAILMDEPFASVDAQTRADLEDLMLRVRRTFGVTIVLVTHDIDEAVYLSDRVVVLQGSPARLERIVPVNLGEERDQIGTKATPEFATLRSEIYQMIRRRQPAAAVAA